MVIVIEGYAPEPFDVLQQVFTTFLLNTLQSYECYYFFSVEILGVEHVYYDILRWDWSWHQASVPGVYPVI